jgi:Ala-tRNA(Pro) deacylase
VPAVFVFATTPVYRTGIMAEAAPHRGQLADGTPAAGPDALFARLETLGIAVTTYHHAAVFTVEEARVVRGDIPGGRSKNLFLRDKKGQMALFSAPAGLAVDLKRLAQLIGARGRLSFGSDERLMKYLGVLPGAVSPFAIINDTGHAVRVVLERRLLEAEPLNFHPLDNTMTTSIAAQDVLRFLEAERHPPLIVQLD